MKRYMYTTHVNGYSIIYIYILYSYIFNIYQVPHVIPKFLRVRKVRKKGTNLGYVSMSSKSGRFRKKRSRIIILSCSLENLSGKYINLYPNTLSPARHHLPAAPGHGCTFTSSSTSCLCLCCPMAFARSSAVIPHSFKFHECYLKHPCWHRHCIATTFSGDATASPNKILVLPAGKTQRIKNFGISLHQLDLQVSP